MKIHEYQAKDLFTSYGIPTGKYFICKNTVEVAKAYDDLSASKVVIKAQVLTGGRGKAGGVQLANNRYEAIDHADTILKLKIKDLEVEKVMLTEAIKIDKEFYVSFVIDRNTKSIILMMSREGGVDIEMVAKNTPEKIYRFPIDPAVGLPIFLARQYAWLFFDDLKQVNQFTSILQKLYKLFLHSDASLAEINPLVRTKDYEILALDAKMTFDANAAYRQEGIQKLFELTDEELVEASAKKNGFSYVQLDGEIGCMVNGAGLAMATMDMIKLYGGKPANFLDIGGSSNPNKIIEALKLLLKDKNVKVVLINIFGGITRCDDVAEGLQIALKEFKTEIPVIVRLTGTNEIEGREILKGSTFMVAETMGDAVQLAVKSNK